MRRPAVLLRRAVLLRMVLAAPLASQASSSLAVEMGCYNCHGTPLRAEPLRRIPAHERLSPGTVQRLIHWLFDGAK